MSFNSIHFLLFFPLVVVLYFSLSQKYRWILLLIASYYFYMSWKPEYVILIFVSTTIDYFAAHKIAQSTKKQTKKLFLGLSLLSNLGLLFLFKYFNFFSAAFAQFLQSISIPFHPTTLQLLLPVGISFYTFQTLSYTIDVYRQKIQPEKHFGIFAVYVSFFPQLVAGPIERAKHLLPQFKTKHQFDYQRIISGLQMMLWGFFKKIVIADRLAPIVDTVYSNPTSYSGIPLILATILFAFQIFCDFSGYSDIAIGAAKVMGFDLMENFRRPYLSRSIKEFWQRWHISLSTWFRDYLYIPLGGNRVSIPRWVINIIIVFTISGLWHGANWTFIVWGFFHGILLVLGQGLKPAKKFFYQKSKLAKWPRLIQVLEIAITFILVNIGWIFFRANNISDAFYILTKSLKNLSLDPSNIVIGTNWIDLSLAFFFIAFMEIVHLLRERNNSSQLIFKKPLVIRWSVYLLLILFILLFGVFDQSQFIYFQF